MKLTKYFLFSALALGLGLTSCSSDDTANAEQKGDPTSFILSIAQPKTYAATDANATDDEVKLNTVDVFIYSGTGVFERHQGLTSGDFDVATNVYTLKATSKIASTTGLKSIYVGVNLPSTLVLSIEQNGVSAKETEMAIANFTATTGFAMFSKTVATSTLVAAEASNMVNLTVQRLVAKVIVSTTAAFSTEVTSGGAVSDLKFATANDNNKFFPLPLLVSGVTNDPNHTGTTAYGTDFNTVTLPQVAAATYKPVNSSGYDITNLTTNCFYTLENTHVDAIKGEHTYATIKAKFLPVSTWFYTYVGTTLTAVPSTLAAGDPFYVVATGGYNYYFVDEDQAIAYDAANNAATAPTVSSVFANYPTGEAYYKVFLTTNNDTLYSVLRNNIYKVEIAKINSIGAGENGITPGGNGTAEPDKPTDPIAVPTNLTVIVTMEPWTLNTQIVELP